MGYVTTRLAEPGTALTIDVRGRARRARLVRKPIYKREET
jgi:glycine cleavage system aminomethyltransferase T